MYNVQFKVSEQSLVKTGGISTYASDTVEYVRANFTFDDSWDDYDSIKAIWQNGFIVRSSPLNSGNSCIVPAEVLAEKGSVKVNLVGTTVTDNVVSKRITTFQVNAFTVTVKVNIDGSDPQPITPSEYEQFVAAVKADADRAEAGAEAAEASEENALASAQASETSAIRSANSASDSASSATASADSAEQAQIHAQNAYNSAVTAGTEADRAEVEADRAEQAAADAGFMEFYINDAGHLIMEHTENVDNIDFELVNGHLVLEVA